MKSDLRPADFRITVSFVPLMWLSNLLKSSWLPVQHVAMVVTLSGQRLFDYSNQFLCSFPM